MADAQGNRYGPYDIEVPGSESEALTEDAWFDLFGHVSGVKSGGALTFNGLTANLSPIDARVHGSYLIREDPWSDASPATSTSAPRRDLLVARRQRTSGEGAGAVPGKTFLTVLRGTPAGTPVDPTHDPDDDERLFSWQVPGNGGTVITGVRDHRRWLDPTSGASWLYGVEMLRAGAGVDLPHNSLEGQGFAATDVVSDVGGFYTGTGNTVLTVPAGRGGLYLVSVGSGIAGGPVEARFFLSVNVNGIGRFRANSFGDDSASTSHPIRLAAGDTIGVDAFQAGGSTRKLNGLALSAHRIGT